jgi:hypothetical protein
MKKSIILVLWIVLLATAVSAAHLTTKQLTCRAVSTECNNVGEVEILHIANSLNSHAELFTRSAYSLNICCGLDGGNRRDGLGNSCTDSSDIVVQLRTGTNAHGALKFFDGSAYNNPVCISAPGEVHCISGEQPQINGNPDTRYECVVAINGNQNAHFATCLSAPSSYQKVWCRAADYIERLPRFWHEAYGDLYDDFDPGHSRLEDTFGTGANERTNVVVVTDRDSSVYGVTSDRYYVNSSAGFVTASVNVSCSQGVGVIELEFWNGNGEKITPFEKTLSTKTNEWERLGVSVAVPANAVQVSVLLRSKKEGFIGAARATCGFDDAQLEFSSERHLVAPLFTPYADYEGELLATPTIPYITRTQSGYACCPENTCWDGITCHENQAELPQSPPVNDYRCIDGSWTFTPGRVGLFGEEGYCPIETQCLVAAQGNPEVNGEPLAFYSSKETNDWPQCINDGQFLLDDYCEAGEWTTRTRLLAKDILQLVEDRGDRNEYTLYCDQYDLSLVEFKNNFDSILGFEKQSADALSAGLRSCFRDIDAPCTNNFCVLEFKEGSNVKRAVGLSLNGDIDGGESIFPVFGYSRTACNGKGANGFEQCGNGDDADETLWYNNQTDTIIYSKEGINMEPLTGAAALFRAFGGILDNVVGFFFAGPVIEEDVMFVQSTTQFDRLYVHAAGNKRINAIQETVIFRVDDDKTDNDPGDIDSRSFILARYHKFDENLCDLMSRVDSSALSFDADSDIIRCDDQVDDDGDKIFTVYTDDLGELFDDSDGAVDKWQDFTSKLRVD